MRYLAEIQMLSLALQGDWDGMRKIAAIMKVDALRHFAGTCEWLYYFASAILSDKQLALAKEHDENIPPLQAQPITGGALGSLEGREGEEE